MAEELENSEELTNTKEQKETNKEIKASIGDIVQIKRGPKKGDKGKVTVLRDNSVIVELGINPKTNEPLKTVVNHKNYKKIK